MELDVFIACRTNCLFVKFEKLLPLVNLKSLTAAVLKAC